VGMSSVFGCFMVCLLKFLRMWIHKWTVCRFVSQMPGPFYTGKNCWMKIAGCFNILFASSIRDPGTETFVFLKGPVSGGEILSNSSRLWSIKNH